MHSAYPCDCSKACAFSGVSQRAGRLSRDLLLAVAAGAGAGFAAEDVVEVAQVAEAALHGDVEYGAVRGYQKLRGARAAQRRKIIHEGAAGLLFEEGVEVAAAQAARLQHVVHADRVHEVGIEIENGVLDAAAGERLQSFDRDLELGVPHQGDKELNELQPDGPRVSSVAMLKLPEHRVEEGVHSFGADLRQHDPVLFAGVQFDEAQHVERLLLRVHRRREELFREQHLHRTDLLALGRYYGAARIEQQASRGNIGGAVIGAELAGAVTAEEQLVDRVAGAPPFGLLSPEGSPVNRYRSDKKQ